MATWNKTSLEDFFKSYLADKTKKNEAQDFNTYKRTHFEDYDREYRDGVMGARLKNKRDKATFGTTSEKVSELGLGSSGYSERVKQLADNSFKSRINELTDEHGKDAARAARSYSAYLNGYNKKQQSLYKSFIGKLAEFDGIAEPSEVYKYAIDQGLNKENAMAAYQGITLAAKEKVKHRVIYYAMIGRMSPEQAIAYAEGSGLSKEDADWIASIVKKYQTLDEEAGEAYIESITQMGNDKYSQHKG